jgi:hypothetical protein
MSIAATGTAGCDGVMESTRTVAAAGSAATAVAVAATVAATGSACD